MIIIMHLHRDPKGRKDTVESRHELVGVAITTTLAVDPGVHSGVSLALAVIPFRAYRVYFRHSPFLASRTDKVPIELKTIPSLEYEGEPSLRLLDLTGFKLGRYFLNTAIDAFDLAIYNGVERVKKEIPFMVEEIKRYFEAQGLEPNYVTAISFQIEDEDSSQYDVDYLKRNPDVSTDAFLTKALEPLTHKIPDVFFFEDQFARSHKATASLIRNRSIWESAAMFVARDRYGAEIPHVLVLANVWRRFMLRDGKATKAKVEAEAELRARLYEMADDRTVDILTRLTSDMIESVGIALYGTAYTFAFYSTFGEAPGAKKMQKLEKKKERLNDRLKPTLSYLLWSGGLKIVE